MYKMFKYRLSDKLNTVHSIKQLRNLLLEEKVIHNKYRYKIEKMDLNELKNFVYTGLYIDNEFEGIGEIFICIYRKDFKRLVKYILKTSLNPLSILRLMLYTISHVENYSGKFKLYIKDFINTKEKRLRSLLFEIGQYYTIDKLDLIEFFNKIIY